MFAIQLFGRLVLFLFVLALLSASLPAADSPNQVLVVNTADGSVSLVDLTKMAEIKQFKVAHFDTDLAFAPLSKWRLKTSEFTRTGRTEFKAARSEANLRTRVRAPNENTIQMARPDGA